MIAARVGTGFSDKLLTLWTRLSRFLEHPELELGNNLVENAIRPLALGRRNWLHIGSEQAGPRVAAIISVVETCRLLPLPLRVRKREDQWR